MEPQASKTVPVDARGAKLFADYLLIGIPDGNDGHGTRLLLGDPVVLKSTCMW